MPSLGQHILGLLFTCTHHLGTQCGSSAAMNFFLVQICLMIWSHFSFLIQTSGPSPKKFLANMSFELLVTDMSKVHCFDADLLSSVPPVASR